MTSQPAIRERDKNGHLKAGIRLPGWDYCKPWFYMITLVVKRRRPILGEIRDGAFVPSPRWVSSLRSLTSNSVPQMPRSRERRGM